MNFTTTSILAVFFTLISLAGCKQDDEPDQDPAPIAADSSSFSTLIVSCKSSDPLSTGIAVLDIQRYFLSKNVVESTINGKLFSVKSANEGDFKAVIDKTTLDFQTPEAYFKNYDSFVALLDERFKTKTGFQKSYDLTQQQVEQLINGQDLTLAYQSSRRRPVFLASSLLLSAGLGTVTVQTGAKTPANVIFTLGRFQSTLNVSSRIVGTTRSYGRLGHYFIDPAATTRHTANTQGSQIFVASYNSTGSLGGYSYTYPLPPSPAPIFGAPVWYWHQYTQPSTGQTFTVFPPNVSTSGFDITNFNASSVALDTRVNATIAGGIVDLVYNAGNSQAQIGPKNQFELKNGWESTFTFSAQTGQRILIGTTDSKRGSRYFGIFTSQIGTDGIALMSLQQVRLLQKTTPTIFDNKIHKVRVSLANKPNNSGSRVEIYLDDTQIYVGDDPNSLSFIHNEPMQMSVVAFNNPVGDGKYKVHSWMFKTY